MDQDIEQLEKWRNYFQEQLELLNKDLEDAKRQIEEKKKEPEFGYKNKMPEGSVWLGTEHLKVSRIEKYSQYPVFKSVSAAEESYKEIYFAHQIVKAAQRSVKSQFDGVDEFKKHYDLLEEEIQKAEKAGVLQNLE